MPVILEPDDWSRWLAVGQGGTPIDDIVSLMVPADESIISPRDVGTAVNSVRNKDASLIEPL
jgi:putative SOS response-associated peptidase YedK